MQKQQINLEDRFDEAYLIAASLVRMYGDVYLPIFKRMHDEKLKRDAKDDLIKQALAVSQNAS